MITRWWHAGEENMITKYENRNFWDVMFQVIFVIALWFLLPQRYTFIPIIFAFTYVPYVITEARIAIIFSPSEVIYRPLLRSPRRIKFEHIVEIRKVSVRRFVAGTFAGFDAGVALRVLGGETVHWRLCIQNPAHVLQQLHRMTGKPIK